MSEESAMSEELGRSQKSVKIIWEGLGPISSSHSREKLCRSVKRPEARKRAGGVNQDTSSNNRVFDLRAPANQAILRIQGHIENASREFLLSNDFDSIHTPKFDFDGQPACLDQSAQFHKQMAICGGFSRVFEVGPCFFRVADQKLCEFIVLDVEMEIHKQYSEIMDLVDQLSLFIFTCLNDKCKKQLEAVGNQYPFEPLKFLPKTLRITFAQGVQMLNEAGVEVDPLGALNTKSKIKLGKLVLEKYNTDFYILHRFPLKVRPFFTMPCEDDPRYSNSFDVFLRGEEIISGAQHIHDADFLEKRAGECGIDVKTISTYMDSFRYGTPLHGGFRVVLERMAMLYCALN